MLSGFKNYGIIKALCSAVLACIAVQTCNAQQSQQKPVAVWNGASVVYLYQGERRELSEDFVAYLQGGSLSVSLQTSGQITPDSNRQLLVSLVQPGAPTVEQRPDDSGRVVFAAVREGLAALVVTADSFSRTSVASLYAAIPIFIARPAAGTPSGGVQVPLAVVQPEEIAADLQASPTASDGAAELTPLDEYQVVPASRFRVLRGANNTVSGQVIVPQRGYEVAIPPERISLYKDGQLVATTTTERDGSFVLPNAPSGTNSLIATGAAGHAAYSIEVLDAQEGELIEPSAMWSGSKAARFVATTAAQPAAGQSLRVVLVPPALVPEVQRVVQRRQSGGGPLAAMPPGVTPGAAPAGGQFAGGGFGGGGAGGGGGGMAALGAVGIAAGIAAASDDDGFFVPPLSTGIAP